MLTCFERETILIGELLLFESEAAKWVLPRLSANKFIFSKTGQLGSTDHKHVWATIELIYAQKKSPNIANVMAAMNQKYGWSHAELTSYVDRVKGYYRIHTLDPQALMELAEEVDKAGIAYNTMSYGSPFVKLLDSTEDFQNYVDNKIDDIDIWVNEYTQNFQSSLHRTSEEGYEHVSYVIDRAKERWGSIFSGEGNLLLPIGLPSITRHGLFQPGTLTTVHGMSNMGKTAFVNQICLGTAIGLQKNNIPGCVAINSMEMTDISLIERMASSLSGFNRSKLLQGPSALQGDDYKRFVKAAEYVATLPIYVDTTNLIKTSVMEYRLNGIHSSDRGPLRLLATDYMELFGDSDDGNKEQNLNRVIRNQLGISRTTGAAVVTISQSTYGDGDNRARIAGAGGVRYSQAIRHATDDLMEIWNPVAMTRAGIDYRVPEQLDDEHFWVWVQKRREGGIPDPISFFWEGEYTRIIDPYLSYGRSEALLFDHFLEDKEVQEIKTVVPVTETEEFDWSQGLGGGAF
jgi:replicative DNA helicase